LEARLIAVGHMSNRGKIVTFLTQVLE